MLSKQMMNNYCHVYNLGKLNETISRETGEACGCVATFCIDKAVHIIGVYMQYLLSLRFFSPLV